jgi:hypothetical protein
VGRSSASLAADVDLGGMIVAIIWVVAPSTAQPAKMLNISLAKSP